MNPARCALQCRVRSRIPAFHRFRLLSVYCRLVLLYDGAIALLGVSTLVALQAAGAVDTGIADVEVGTPFREGAGEAIRAAGVMGALLLMTVGHWLGVVVVNLVHRDEYALYRSGGWGRTELWFASWPVSVAVGLLVLALVGA